MDKIKIKERLKTAEIILIGIIAISLILLLLYGLVTGRVQKTIVKYEALHYMENKYKEKFEIKQIFGADKIWKTSWGYELWMVPKNKPDKDYTSDMEVYVFKKNGKFHENFKMLDNNYLTWKYFREKIEKIFLGKNYYYFIWAKKNNISISFQNITNRDKEEIRMGLNFYLFLKNENFNNKIKKKLFLLLNSFSKEYFIKNINIQIYIYDINKKISKEELNGILKYEKLKYYIEIQNDDYRKINKLEDIEKYIIDNRGN